MALVRWQGGTASATMAAGWLMKRLDKGHPKAVAYKCQGWMWPVRMSRASTVYITPASTSATTTCCLPGVAVGDAAGDWGQHQNRDGLDAVHQAELNRRVGQLVHEPPTDHLIHPSPWPWPPAGPEQTELTVAQCCKGPQAQQRPPGLPCTPGWVAFGSGAPGAAVSVCGTRGGGSTSGRPLVTFASLLVSFRRPSR